MQGENYINAQIFHLSIIINLPHAKNKIVKIS